MTGNIDRIEVITSVRGDGAGRRKRRLGSCMRPTRRECRCVGVAGGATARGRTEPSIQLATAVCRAPAARGRSRRGSGARLMQPACCGPIRTKAVDNIWQDSAASFGLPSDPLHASIFAPSGPAQSRESDATIADARAPVMLGWSDVKCANQESS